MLVRSFSGENGILRKFVFLRFGYIQSATVVLFFQIFFIVGIGKCSALAPDERSYLRLFEDLRLVGSSNLLNFAGTSIWIYELFFFPGVLLAKVGIDPIYSIRGSAIVHSQIILALCWSFIRQIPRSRRTPFFLIPIGLSLSFFGFSSLGLRDSIVFLIIVLYFTGLNLIKKKFRFGGGLLLLLALFLMANLKFHLYLVMLLTALVALFFPQVRKDLKLTSTVVFASIFLVFISPTAEHSRISDVVKPGAIKFELRELKLFTFDFANLFKTRDGNIGITRAELVQCKKNNSFGFLGPIFNGLLNEDSVTLEQSEKVNSKQGQEDLVATDLYGATKPRGVIILGHLPFNLVNFVFGPLPGTAGGSSQLGVFDSLLWFVFYIFIALVLLGRSRYRLQFDSVVVFSFAFILVFSFASAAFEVNSGTGFRHRILLLIPMLAIFSRMRLQKAEAH